MCFIGTLTGDTGLTIFAVVTSIITYRSCVFLFLAVVSVHSKLLTTFELTTRIEASQEERRKKSKLLDEDCLLLYLFTEQDGLQWTWVTLSHSALFALSWSLLPPSRLCLHWLLCILGSNRQQC